DRCLHVPYIPPPPKSTLFPYTTLFRSRTYKHALAIRADCALQSPRRRERSFAAGIGQVLHKAFTIPPFGASTTSARGRVHRTERSEEHTSELQSQSNLVCRLLLEKTKG